MMSFFELESLLSRLFSPLESLAYPVLSFFIRVITVVLGVFQRLISDLDSALKISCYHHGVKIDTYYNLRRFVSPQRALNEPNSKYYALIQQHL
jgi:hypothetical protein